MNPDKWNVSIKSLRKREYLLAVVFGVFPLICAWIYCLKDGAVSEEIFDTKGENLISISGICSELIVSNS